MAKKQFSSQTLGKMQQLDTKISKAGKSTTIRTNNNDRFIVVSDKQAKQLGFGSK